MSQVKRIPFTGKGARFSTDKEGIKYIRPSSLTDCGLIFVATSDPIGRLTLGITKQEFSTIGFYYYTSISGRKKVNVILVDLFNHSISDKETTIETLINNPLVTSIAVKRLKPVMMNGTIDEIMTKQMHANYRSAIINAVANYNDKLPSHKDYLYQLFGIHGNGASPISETLNGRGTNGLTGVGLVNSVIRRIGKLSMIETSDTISLSCLERLTAVPNTPNEVISFLGSTLNQQVCDKQLSSYIVDNSLFSDLYFLRTGVFPQEVINTAMAHAISKQKPYLFGLIETFTDLLFNDEKFFNSIVNGIREGKLRDESQLHILKEALEACAENRVQDLQFIINAMIEGEIKASDIQTIINEANDDRISVDNLSSTIRSCLQSTSLYGEPYRSSGMSLINIPSMNAKLNTAIIGDMRTSELEESINSLYSMVSDLALSAREGKQGYIDINSLISCTNRIASASGRPTREIPLLKEDTSFSVVASSTTSKEEVSITLSEGEEVILPLRGCNLSSMERSVLLDILQILDDNMYNIDTEEYDTYDDLRAKISTELSTR